MLPVKQIVFSSALCLLFMSGQLFAKELANGWTDKTYKKHYMGCMKGAIGATLKRMVNDGKITKQTDKKARKAIIGKLYNRYEPLCKCVQNSIMEKVQYKDIKAKTKDKAFRQAITKACVDKLIKK